MTVRESRTLLELFTKYKEKRHMTTLLPKRQEETSFEWTKE